MELRDSWAIVISTPAHACLQSTHHRLGVFRRVGYNGFESAAQRLSPTSPSSGHAPANSLLRQPMLFACHSGAVLERCKQSFRSSQRNQHGKGVAAATGFFPAMRARLSLNRVYKPACHQPTSGAANGGFLLLPKGKSYARSCQCRAHRRVPLTGDHRSCGRPQSPSLGHPDRTVCVGCLMAFS